jgi:hypothetical protein
MRLILAFAILVASLAAASSASGADRCQPQSPIGYGGLSEKAFTIYVKRDTPCTLAFTLWSFAEFRQKITRAPRGFYRVRNSIFGTYSPPAGYTGDDYFEVQLTYRRLGLGQQRQRSLLKVTAQII